MPPREGFPDAKHQALQLQSLSGEEAITRALQFVNTRLEGRPLIVLIDDLDRVFAALGDTALARLRAILQERGGWSIVGAARRKTAHFSDREKPFFSMFARHELPALSAGEGWQLLTALVQLRGQRELAAALECVERREQVRRCLERLGGHPLAAVRLAEHLSVAALERLELALWPLAVVEWGRLMERLDGLSAGQQAALSPLVHGAEAMTVGAIARQAFQAPQVTSSHLRRLGKEGWVWARRSGRERHYDLSDPLVRFAVEFMVTAGSRTARKQPLRSQR